MGEDIKCTVNEFKLVLGINGDDGALLYREEGETCTYTANIDLMLKFKCDDLINCVSDENTILNIFRKTKVDFSIEDVDDSTSTYLTKPNYRFDMATTGTTGVYITGISDEGCKCDLYDQIREELSQEGSDCSLLTDSSFGAIWNSFSFRIPKQFYGKTIKIGLVITKTDCCDFSLLVDNLSIDKDCTQLEDKETKILSSPGFELERICDNKKSWIGNKTVENRSHSLEFRNTGYNIEDDRLSINSKEVDIQVDPASAIECDLVDFLNKTTCTTYSGNCGVGTVSTDTLCKDCISIFESSAYDGLVDIKNRQTIGSYPRLRMVLDRYLYNSDCCVSGTTALTYENVHQFSKLLNPRFMEIVEEMVPSTSIWNGALVIRNTIFDQQKYRYRDYGLIEVCGATALGDFNALTEGTDYITGGTTNTNTVEIIKEDIYGVEPKCKGCHDDIKKKCNNVYITKKSAEQIFEGSITFKESVSVNSYGRLVLTEEVTDTGDGTTGGGTTTDTTPLGSTSSGGDNTYNIEERFDI